MGETDEKENVPAGTPTAEIETEPKETEKLLNTDEKKAETELPTNGKESPSDDAKPYEQQSSEKANGEEVIDIPEEKKQKEDEREVKLKKNPIASIKLPGFLTRNKSKQSENDDVEGELLKNAGNDTKTEGQVKDENAEVPPSSTRQNFLTSLPSLPPLPKFRNPFTKKNTLPKDEESGVKETGVKVEVENPNTEKVIEEKTGNEEENPKKEKEKEKDDNEQAPPTSKKIPLKFPTIRLSQLPNLIPKRLRSNNQQTEDLELGNGPNNKAGLASMETLDDSIKDNETNKDVTDRATIPSDEGLETVKLNESGKEKEAEKDGKVGETEVQKQPIIERIRNFSFSVDDLAIVGGILLFLLLVAIICIFTFSGSSTLKVPPLRDGKYIRAVTSCGPVEGVVEDSSYAFRGIPYAVPPKDDRRFKAAEPIERLEDCWNETLKAYSPALVCWQIFANSTLDGTEDCLTLDVITPYVRYENPLPVIVLIGADSLIGESPNKLRPSARLAHQRDVVFVRPNFRLGVLGFLALEELSKSVRPPTSGNYALTDILAVLRWIQLNIHHFGGDSKSVTLLGHRAGATIVSALITSPKAKDLFARAWVTSGSAIFPGKSLAEYERANAQEFKIDCSAPINGSCLYSTSAEELLDLVPDTWRPQLPDLPKDDDLGNRHEWLVLDGEVLQKHPADIWNREPGSPPRLVIGTTAHESHSEKLFNKYKPWTPELVRQHIQQSKIGDLGLTDEVLKRYNATYQGLVQIISDIRTVCPLLTIARAQPSVPFYVVTRTGGDLEIATDIDDIQAILGRYEPKTYEQRRYAQAVQQLFYHYVAHGEFKQYEPRKRVMMIDQDALSFDDYPNCDFWIKNDIVPRYARID